MLSFQDVESLELYITFNIINICHAAMPGTHVPSSMTACARHPAARPPRRPWPYGPFSDSPDRIISSCMQHPEVCICSQKSEIFSGCTSAPPRHTSPRADDPLRVARRGRAGAVLVARPLGGIATRVPTALAPAYVGIRGRGALFRAHC